MSSGPDQLLPAESFTTISPDGSVNLRFGEGYVGDNDEVISVPSKFKRAVKIARNKTALAVKRDGDWVKWTFQEYLQVK